MGWFCSICVCLCVCTQYIWILKVHTDHIMIVPEHPEAPTEKIHSHSSSADPELPPHIPLSIIPSIPLLIPLSNPSLSFHLRSNNISNPYSQPAIPPMAISATALEIFNTLYPQFGWVILKKFFFFLGGGGVCAVTWVHDAYWILRLLFHLSSLCFSFSLCHRWTDQSRWSQQTVRVEEVPYALPSFFSFPPPCYLPSFVPALQTCCLCPSASPLSVPLDDALYPDAGWQRGLAGPSTIQNALCKRSSSWLARPLAPFLQFHHMHWCMYMHAHTQKHACLVMLEGKTGH